MVWMGTYRIFPITCAREFQHGTRSPMKMQDGTKHSGLNLKHLQHHKFLDQYASRKRIRNSRCHQHVHMIKIFQDVSCVKNLLMNFKYHFVWDMRGNVLLWEALKNWTHHCILHTADREMIDDCILTYWVIFACIHPSVRPSIHPHHILHINQVHQSVPPSIRASSIP